MKPNPKRAQFGRPAEYKTKPYIAHLYCAVHNGVPVMRDWPDYEIAPLFPMPSRVLVDGREQVVTLMVCGPCMAKVQAKAYEQMRHMVHDQRNE